MLSLAMQLGLAVPLYIAPHHIAPLPEPAPAVVASPIVVQAPRGTGGGGVPASLPPAPAPTPPPVTMPPAFATINPGGPENAPAASGPATTPTTTYNGLECVVTVYGADGTHMTYSPGPAVNGQCAEGVAEPVTSTS